MENHNKVSDSLASGIIWQEHANVILSWSFSKRYSFFAQSGQHFAYDFWMYFVDFDLIVQWNLFPSYGPVAKEKVVI